jgi:hypothetical protein
VQLVVRKGILVVAIPCKLEGIFDSICTLLALEIGVALAPAVDTWIRPSEHTLHREGHECGSGEETRMMHDCLLQPGSVVETRLSCLTFFFSVLVLFSVFGFVFFL